MPRRCTICIHPERHEIDKALVGGGTYRQIAESHGLSTSSLFRHKQDHLPAHLAKAAEIVGTDDALDVVQQLRAINAACLEVLTKARASGRDERMLRAVDRIHRQIELQARLLGELQEGRTVNIVVLPEWQRIRTRIVTAVDPYPEARKAVIRALSDAGA